MLSKIQPYLLLPLAIILICLYLLGFRIWQNRSQNLVLLPTENPAVVSQESRNTSSSVPKLNLNTATQEELESIPGIGAKTAQRILEKREEIGTFRFLEQLMEVSGIGEKTLESLKEFITIE